MRCYPPGRVLVALHWGVAPCCTAATKLSLPSRSPACCSHGAANQGAARILPGGRTGQEEQPGGGEQSSLSGPWRAVGRGGRRHACCGSAVQDGGFASPLDHPSRAPRTQSVPDPLAPMDSQLHNPWPAAAGVVPQHMLHRRHTAGSGACGALLLGGATTLGARLLLSSHGGTAAAACSAAAASVCPCAWPTLNVHACKPTCKERQYQYTSCNSRCVNPCMLRHLTLQTKSGRPPAWLHRRLLAAAALPLLPPQPPGPQLARPLCGQSLLTEWHTAAAPPGPLPAACQSRLPIPPLR